jgi:hypothetical protein
VAFRAAILALVLLGAATSSVTAQTVASARPDRPGPYVIDIRGSTIGAPQSPAFYPDLPAGTIIPTRAFGFDIGAHVYLFQLGPARIGIGADLFRLRGSASPPDPEESRSGTPSAPPALPESPDTRSSFNAIAPQISFNFGGSDGWSYISVGLGRAQVTTERSVFDDGLAETRKSGSVANQNFGGGARWFRSDHLAFTFDLRFHLLSPGVGQPIPGETDELTTGTPRTKVVSASVGISLR